MKQNETLQTTKEGSKMKLYKLQKKLMDTYIVAGLKLFHLLDSGKDKLRKHINNVADHTPTSCGVTPDQLNKCLWHGHEEELKWAKEKFDDFKKIFPSLTYEKFMQLADLSLAECEDPPKPPKKEDKEVKCQCQRAMEQVADNQRSIQVPNQITMDPIDIQVTDTAISDITTDEDIDKENENSLDLIDLGEELLKHVELCKQDLAPTIKRGVEDGIEKLKKSILERIK